MALWPTIIDDLTRLNKALFDAVKAYIDDTIGIQGVPTGGATHDILTKASAANYDDAWTDAPTLDSVTLDTAAAEATGIAKLFWSAQDGTPAVGLAGGNVTYSLGAQEFVTVSNRTGSPITAGKAVYILGAHGDRVEVALADATSETTAARTLGITAETIADNGTGLVCVSGILRNLNTNTLTQGQIVWLAASPGGLTSTRPTQPKHGVFLGVCVKQGLGTSGILYVSVVNGQELDELHDVLISTPAAYDILQRNAANTLWVNTPSSSISIGTAADLGGGTAGQLPYQASPGDTQFLGPGTAGDLLKSNGTSGPTFVAPAALTKTDDTNVTLTLGGSASTALVNAASITAGWTGTLASTRLNSNVVQGVTNDTNITGSIAAQNLTLGWTGTLAAARLNANVVQGITNDTNVTGSIATQTLTLGWMGQLAIARGGTGASTQQAALNALAGAVTSGQYLRGNGTNVLMSAIQAGDVPTLNQNTTGSAATLTTARNLWGNSFNGSADLTGAIQLSAGAITAPALTFSSDLNTGLWAPAADTLAASTGGVERFRLDNSGNIGQGVTPSAWGANWVAYQLGSGGAFVGRTTNAGIYVTSNLYFDGTDYRYLTTDFASYTRQYQGDHLFYSAASGTAGTVPTFTTLLRLLANGDVAMDATKKLFFDSTAGIGDTYITESSSNVLSLYAGGVQRVNVTATGVGIGVAAPGQILDIANEGGGANFRIARYSTDANSPSIVQRKIRGTIASPTAVATGDQLGVLSFQAYGGTNYRVGGQISGHVTTYVSDTNMTTEMRFYTINAGAGASEWMRLTGTGKLGLINTAPSEILHIGNNNVQQDSRVLFETGNGTQQRKFSAGIKYGNTDTTGTNYSFAIRDETAAADRVVINYSTGNVGINNTAPQVKLHVGSGTFASSIIGQIVAADTSAAYITATDGTRQTFIGADASTGGMAGTLTAHAFEIRTSNTARLTFGASANATFSTTVIAPTYSTSGAYSAQGNFGSIAASWAGLAYPTLYSDNADRWVMHINPHISHVKNGVNGYTGTSTGAMIRFASDTSATTYWDIGVATNGQAADVWGMGRGGVAFMITGNTGNTSIGPTSGKMFIGDVGHGTAYAALAHQDYATTTGYAFLAGNNGYTFINKRDLAGTYIGIRKGNADIMTFHNNNHVAINATARLYLDGTGASGDTYIEENAANTLYLVAGAAAYGYTTGGFAPANDNARNLGGTGNRWTAVYAVNGTIQTSDRTKKRHIVPTPLGAEFVRQLRPVEFTLEGEPDTCRRQGLIAQEVLALADRQQLHGIITGDADGDYGIHYAGLVPALIAALQAQDARIAALEAQQEGQ